MQSKVEHDKLIVVERLTWVSEMRDERKLEKKKGIVSRAP